MHAAGYQPRTVEGAVLQRVVRENLETFLADVATRTDGGGLPHFVEREFREFLTCGCSAGKTEHAARDAQAEARHRFCTELREGQREAETHSRVR